MCFGLYGSRKTGPFPNWTRLLDNMAFSFDPARHNRCALKFVLMRSPIPCLFPRRTSDVNHQNVRLSDRLPMSGKDEQ